MQNSIVYLKKENNVIQYTPQITQVVNIEASRIAKLENENAELVFINIDENLENLKLQGYIDATEEEYSAFLLPILKNQLIQEARNFFQNLRYFNIKKNDVAIMTLKAEQSLTDAVQSWINELQDVSRQPYRYLGLTLSLEQCQNFLCHISILRNKCAKLEEYYCGSERTKIIGVIQSITSYQELQSFNYKIDPETKQIIDSNFFPPLILE
jgi:hypothetical protein